MALRPPFIHAGESDIIQTVDVLITRVALLELKALNALKPRPRFWGLLIGHKRGFRFIVERIFPAGEAASRPSAEGFEALDRLSEGRIIGVFAVRPGVSLRRTFLDPFFYGKLFLDVSLGGKGPCVKSYVVEYDRAFFFLPVPLEPGSKGGTHG